VIWHKKKEAAKRQICEADVFVNDFVAADNNSKIV